MMSAKFNTIINSRRPVLVDFYTDWCAPCKQMPPILKQVKNELKENVRIIKVNVDKNPIIASKYQIRNLPTIMIFKNGEAKWSGVGIRNAEELKAMLQLQIQED